MLHLPLDSFPNWNSESFRPLQLRDLEDCTSSPPPVYESPFNILLNAWVTVRRPSPICRGVLVIPVLPLLSLFLLLSPYWRNYSWEKHLPYPSLISLFSHRSGRSSSESALGRAGPLRDMERWTGRTQQRLCGRDPKVTDHSEAM